MHRLFVALRPPPQIRDQLVALQGAVEGVRWQNDDQLHLTLRFIGTVDRCTANDIAEALSDIRAPCFDIALSGVGVFEHKGRIDALWAGVAPVAPLAALHHKIDHALVRLGLLPESRAYRPHITLARGRMGPVDHFLARHGGLTSTAFAVGHFALYESVRRSDGSSYIEAVRYSLG